VWGGRFTQVYTGGNESVSVREWWRGGGDSDSDSDSIVEHVGVVHSSVRAVCAYGVRVRRVRVCEKSA
jgi:hypothetical protein